MRHIKAYNEAAETGLFRWIRWEDLADYPIEGATLSRASAAARAIRSALPAGWTVTRVCANHVRPGTEVPPGDHPFNSYSSMKVADQSAWDRIPNSMFYQVTFSLCEGLPEGVVPADYYLSSYAAGTIFKVADVLLSLVRQGWRGTRADFAESREMGDLFEKLPNRRRYTWRTRFKLADQAVGTCLAHRRLAEARDGHDRVLVPGPNLDAEAIHFSHHYPTASVKVGFHEDDWVSLVFMKWASSRSTRIYMTSFIYYICDGDRGLAAALRDMAPKMGQDHP